jgi:predicted transcriptional regulator
VSGRGSKVLNGNELTPAARALRVKDALSKTNGNINQAAKLLGASRETIRRHLRKEKELSQPKEVERLISSDAQPSQEFLQAFAKEVRKTLFRERVGELWREDAEALMAEVTRLHDASR